MNDSFFSTETLASQLIGPVGHMPSESGASWGYDVYCIRTARTICHIPCFGGVEVAEWDAFFVALSLNYHLLGLPLTSLLEDTRRCSSFMVFKSEFPEGFSNVTTDELEDQLTIRLHTRHSDSSVEIISQRPLANTNRFVQLLQLALDKTLKQVIYELDPSFCI